MPCIRTVVNGSPCIITYNDEFKIRAAGKEYRFEFHSHLGPMMISKRGNPIQTFPPQNSPFWDALHWWLKQGKIVDAEGWCVFKWEMKPVNIMKHLGGNNYLVLTGKRKGAENVGEKTKPGVDGRLHLLRIR